MDLREHLYYQQLWTSECPIEDATQTIEKLLLEQKKTSREEIQSITEKRIHELAGDTGILSADDVYRAVVLDIFFSRLDEADIQDGINLARKEAMARRLARLLHEEHIDLARIEGELGRFAELPIGKSQVSTSLAIGIRVQLIRTLISENLFYIGVAKNHITMRDISELISRFVGKHGQKSRIGGKSAGMVLANSILAPAFGDPTGLEEHLGTVDSYYLTAELFNRFIEHNRLEEGHGLKYMDAGERETAEKELEYRFSNGRFPEDVEGYLRDMIEQLGEGPLIVRSSSLLEDSMGFPFYGKYESVFVTNQGDLRHRFGELMSAVRTVYRSILASSVIEYRKDKELLDYDDMMCLLVQKVVGAQHGPYFFPEAAGVAFSRNEYCWSRKLDPGDGIARIVYGLGTRAVDRGGADYPRLIPLGNPEMRPEGTAAERAKYSQRDVDVLNTEKGRFESIHFVDLYNAIRATKSDYNPQEIITISASESPTASVSNLRPASEISYGDAVISFDGVVSDRTLPRLLKAVLQRLETAYGVPVDVEFAWQDRKLYILQCRPLAGATGTGAPVEIPQVADHERVLFETRRDIFRSAIAENIAVIVSVDGVAYQKLESDVARLEVARLLGRVNRALKGRRYMLIGPGRWGSSNLNLGVKVNYGEINNATVLAEVGSTRQGYTPEVSYGTHFFQDLVEADIVPLALFPDEEGSYLDEQFLATAPDALRSVVETEEIAPAVAACVRVIDLEATEGGVVGVYLNAAEERGLSVVSRSVVK
jgi:hypothetical protein